MNETENITEAPHDCDNSGSIWETGKLLFEWDWYIYVIYIIIISRNEYIIFRR